MPFVPTATPSRRQPSREGFTRPDVLLQALDAITTTLRHQIRSS